MVTKTCGEGSGGEVLFEPVAIGEVDGEMDGVEGDFVLV
jgi:hypothetical protein